MRVSNDRYSRELRSIELARRMVRQEARTQTISAWTGLTGERVRNLVRSHGAGDGTCPTPRHRGPSPSDLSSLLATVRIRTEAAAVIGLCRVWRVLPEKPVTNARTVLPGLARGEQLIAAFELFRLIVPQARLTFEQLVPLIYAVAESESWTVDHCLCCHATILIDRMAACPRRLCAACSSQRAPYTPDQTEEEAMTSVIGEVSDAGYQHRLFD